MENKKIQSRKKYGIASNVIYNMKASKIWHKKLFYYQLLMMLPDVASAGLGVLLPAELVRGLEEKWNMMPLLFSVFLLAFVLSSLL